MGPNLTSKNFFGYLFLFIVALVIYVYVTNPLVVGVTGTGEVSVPATNATVSFTISASDSTSPQVAVSNVNAKALGMNAFLESKGIEAGNIAVSQVTVVPSNLVTAGATGYQATISMAAKTSNVADVSTLVSTLYANGAMVVAQPILSVDNQSNLDSQAFNAAMDDAGKQATAIGFRNFKFIKKIVSVTKATSPATSTATTKGDSSSSSLSGVAATNGVFKIVEAVSVTYKMW